MKKQLIDLEEELERVSVDFDLENKKVPNILSPDVPIGSSEEDNFEIKGLELFHSLILSQKII